MRRILVFWVLLPLSAMFAYIAALIWSGREKE